MFGMGQEQGNCTGTPQPSIPPTAAREWWELRGWETSPSITWNTWFSFPALIQSGFPGGAGVEPPQTRVGHARVTLGWPGGIFGGAPEHGRVTLCARAQEKGTSSVQQPRGVRGMQRRGRAEGIGPGGDTVVALGTDPEGTGSTGCLKGSVPAGSVQSAKGEASDEDEETEYFDAMEDAPAFITVTADPKHHRYHPRPAGHVGRVSCSSPSHRVTLRACPPKRSQPLSWGLSLHSWSR